MSKRYYQSSGSSGHGRGGYSQDHHHHYRREEGSYGSERFGSGTESLQIKRYKDTHRPQASSSSGSVLRTNFYPIRMLPNRQFYIYSVSIAIQATRDSLPSDIYSWADSMLKNVYFKNKLFYILRRQGLLNLDSPSQQENIKGLPFFDGSILVSIFELEQFKEVQIPGSLTPRSQQPTPVKVFDITYRRMEHIIPFRITITKLTSVGLNQKIQDVKLDQAVSFCLETLFVNHLDMVLLGKAMCEKTGRIENNFNIRKGVIPSLIFITSGLHLNLTFKQKITASSPIIHNIEHYENTGTSKERISNTFRGCSVVYNNKSYVIKEIDFSQNPLSTFKKDGHDITFRDYYKDRYGVEIKNLKQPLISTTIKMRNQKKQKIYLIPELCYLSGVTKQELRKIPKVTVQQKEIFVRDIVQKANSNKAKEYCDSVGLAIDQNPIQLNLETLNECRIVSPEVVQKRDKWTISTKNLNDYFYQMHDTWLVIGESRDVDELLRVSERHQLPRPIEILIRSSSGHKDEYMNELEKIADWTRIKFVFVLLKDPNKIRYANIKRYLSTEIGVPSQCIVCNSHDWTKRLPNSLFQIAAKAGCIIWTVEKNEDEVFLSICGVELQRRGRMAKGAITISLNSTYTLYHTVTFKNVDIDVAKLEIIKGIEEGLERFIARNLDLPPALIIYYSGQDFLDISESINDLAERLQSKQREQYQTDQFENMFSVCLISVNKDTNARFNTGNYDNTPVGTCVKTLSRMFTQEFYLTSCFISSNIGYSRPVRYQILSNTTKFDVDQLTNITFKQTHLYFNWNGTVRLPAACLYAKKATEAVDTTNEKAHPNLQNSLHFL
ncbi:hypothetical protein C9374_007573 [Naegleria lovaniensis]|uniref:Uncharacterized protein n=1 Tax=Naegleria lovaniensis TaxID=51637 RepID=A0AA88GLG2_NAELO|nr:uncharacterized protein C9374_007573 [Naegleria lovaniensis]KAG2378935.1 hypothetical protein C9374_007573 [Naegleria lovaniensis]